MKRTLGIILLSVFVVILSSGLVIAGNVHDPLIKNRIGAQQMRIDRGIASGCLTRAEARTLRHHVNCIRAQESRFKADGHLTKMERVRLHRMLDKNSRNLYCKKYNTMRRW